MKNGVALGVVVGISTAVFAVWLTTGPPEARGQVTSTANENAQTHVLTIPAASGGQYVLIVDTTARVMGTYDVHPEDGHITLRSVRRYEWDLQMNDFNGADPKPSDVRAIVEQR